MKVFLSSDMEGTAGVVDWAQCAGDGPEASGGRRLLLAEVNAAIEGALAGGEPQLAIRGGTGPSALVRGRRRRA